MDNPLPQDEAGRRRVAIENVRPAIDCGRFAVKRIVGQILVVEADVFADGHDVVRAELVWRDPGAENWQSAPMSALGNDAWRAELSLDQVGRYEFNVRGWVDLFETWHRDLKRRLEASQDVTVDLQIGAALLGQAAQRAAGDDRRRLLAWQQALASPASARAAYLQHADQFDALVGKYPDRQLATLCDRPLPVVVDRQRACYSTWYELFPRSCGSAGRHGTFADCIDWLPRLAAMGFDVLYLPPIHPIGATFRKGKNNAATAQPDDVGSPWAIGAREGGHQAIHAPLGTLSDFKRLVAAARSLDIDVAMDIAFQCSPDHPYAREHRTWFRQRPDGTIQYAENPPKKYQDIYPFDFESEDWRSLWRELTDVVLYWCRQGVRIFRVDNPHTKPFAFWEHLIGEVKRGYPETIFLSEAFTRPKVMYRLAKLGFSQSYSYFTWRNSKAEFIEYFNELTQPPVCEFFRPNLWPNTPDILPEHLQTGVRSAFVGRLVLAATLGASYGIYGPAFETLEHRPRDAGSEEYLDSEKYQVRSWSLDSADGLADVITAVNRARRDNPALQSDRRLKFHDTDNDQLLCYSKSNDDGTNRVVMVVNLDFQHEQHGFVTLALDELGVDGLRPFQVEDLLTGRTFEWDGPRNFVELDPSNTVAHILRVLPQP